MVFEKVLPTQAWFLSRCMHDLLVFKVDVLIFVCLIVNLDLSFLYWCFYVHSWDSRELCPQWFNIGSSSISYWAHIIWDVFHPVVSHSNASCVSDLWCLRTSSNMIHFLGLLCPIPSFHIIFKVCVGSLYNLVFFGAHHWYLSCQKLHHIC